jgi:ribonuclease Y
MSNFILVIAILAVGAFLGYLIRSEIAKRKSHGAEAKAEKILNDAKTRAQEFLIKTKERGLHIIEEAKKEESERRKILLDHEKRIEKRESLFDQKLLEFQEKQQHLQDKLHEVEKIKEKINQLKEDAVVELEKVSGMTAEEAKGEILQMVEEKVKDEAVSRIRKMEAVASEEIENKTRELIANVIQRVAVSHAVEITTTSVNLPNDEMKGRIIGKEGRNIKTIEQLTGTELIIDETPNAITISSFSPIRRQIAKRALDKLIADGRIQPARIEEAIDNAKRELAIEIRKAGEDTLYSLGLEIAGYDPKLVQILGRLRFRTSYGQNVLQHSIEVAHLASLLATELGANASVARRGGLFHDIGKSVDQEVQGTHPEIGYNILKKFGLPEEVAYCALSHHEDKPTTLEAILVKTADAISGTRPGARKETLEQYIQRLEDLEKVATSFSGVEKAYAIQAGREVRVFVKPQEIDDLSAFNLASDIAKKIESELRYPGEIKVIVIRETRAIEYAR